MVLGSLHLSKRRAGGNGRNMMVLDTYYDRYSRADQSKARWAQSAAIFLLHLILVCVFSAYALSYNSGRLFIGNDGPMMISLALEQIAYFGVSLDLHGPTSFRGSAICRFPSMSRALPGFWFTLYDPHRFMLCGIVACYTFFTVVLCLSRCGCWAGMVRFPRRDSAYAAAWLITILLVSRSSTSSVSIR